VKKIVEEGPKIIQELIVLGTPFDKTEGGTLDLGKEGGHSASRIIHMQDQTGKAIVSMLLKQIEKYPNVTILEGYYAEAWDQCITNPLIATEDGIAMAYRAKARIANMEFIQFHPTAFIQTWAFSRLSHYRSIKRNRSLSSLCLPSTPFHV
jgi:L-aspartate oxidase